MASPSRKRQRARKACIPCRSRKRRCDGTFPCGACTGYGYDCRFPADDGPAAAFASHATAPSSPAPTNAHNVLPSQRAHSADGGILDTSRSRYVGQSSVIAFPRTLGVTLGSQNPPAIHSFGWNLGTRPEELSDERCDLAALVSEDESKLYCDTYFTVVAPIFDILDRQTFSERAIEFYHDGRENGVFGSIIAGVVALGSLFHSRPHAKELKVVQYAKGILEDPTSTRRPSIDLVLGWILRTIYLRATTRPNNTWLAGSTAMHLVEAVGLHRDPTTTLRTTGTGSGSAQDPGIFRRVFWCAWALNRIVSYEYSRTAVFLPNITCEPIVPVIGTHMHDWIQIARTIPNPHPEPGSPVESLCNGITSVSAINSSHPMLRLTKADVSFCFYRRLRQQRLDIPTHVLDTLVAIGDDALDAANELIAQGRPWWNILGAVFQYACVLLALDTETSFQKAREVISVLDSIATLLETHLAKEALATAKLLVKAAMAKKKREIALLEKALGGSKQDEDEANGDFANDPALQQELTSLGLDWDLFLNDPFPLELADPDLYIQSEWTHLQTDHAAGSSQSHS